MLPSFTIQSRVNVKKIVISVCRYTVTVLKYIDVQPKC
jgi:hypothetical protein